MDVTSSRLVNPKKSTPYPVAARKNWANWWAQVATAAERRGSKRVDRACLAELYPGYRKCLESEPDYLPMWAEIGRVSVVSADPDFVAPILGAEDEDDDSPEQVVRSALREARATILQLVPRDNHVPSLVRLPTLRDGLLVGVRDGKVTVGGSESRFAERHLLALVHLLLPGRPFLFSRCSHCGRIFARSGRGLRCSTYCTSRVAEAKRTKTETRRKQARESMQKLRARRAQEQRTTMLEGGND